MRKEQRQSGGRKLRPARVAEMELKQPLAKRLAAYALAAGAAGLGIMAGAQPAEAEIVYTHTNRYFSLDPGQRLGLDINGDGITDFYLKSSLFSVGALDAWAMGAYGARANGLLGYPGRFGYFDPWGDAASCLARGARIGPRGAFHRSNLMAGIDGFSSWGAWKAKASGFLGLEFQIDGQTHYGWVQISLFGVGYGVVAGFAYNTIPNEPIRAGQTSDTDFVGEVPHQPAALGLLALGAPGLDIWRPRRRELTAK